MVRRPAALFRGEVAFSSRPSLELECPIAGLGTHIARFHASIPHSTSLHPRMALKLRVRTLTCHFQVMRRLSSRIPFGRSHRPVDTVSSLSAGSCATPPRRRGPAAPPFSIPLVLPSEMRALFVLALACFLGIAYAQTASDPCAFAADSLYTTAWVTTRANILNCFNSVPFSATNRNSLVTILNYTWNGYSFRDYVSEPIAPYNIQVRFL